MKKIDRKQGFSLLELLVVIGIMSILLTFGLSSYSTSQKKSRDAKRRGDLKTIQQAAEQYYSVCGFVYPTNLGTRGISCPTGNVTMIPTESLPMDPKSGSTYGCNGTCNSTQFTLCATPEVDSGTICVTNQQ